MVTVRKERPAEAAARDALLDLAYGAARFTKTSQRLREGRWPELALVAAESRRMVSEKLVAAAEAQQAAVNAALAGKPALIPSRTLAIVRRKIRANQKRLLASKPGAKAGRQKKGRRR